MTERLIKLEGTQNFRDLGGYETAAGRRVKWGRLYRADALSTLSAADLGALAKRGLRTVLDFRSEHETREEPGPFAEGAHARVAYRHLPIGENASPAEWRELLQNGGLGTLDENWLARSYAAMLDGRPQRFAEALRALAAPGALPAVFHCTAGKDRTGVMAMLVLRLLGVSRAQVVADYALTAAYTQNRIRAAQRWFDGIGMSEEQADLLFAARAQNMEAALDHLEQKHGGISNYARDALQLDAATLARLHAALLE